MGDQWVRDLMDLLRDLMDHHLLMLDHLLARIPMRKTLMTRMKLLARRKGDPVNPKNLNLPKSLKHQKKPNLKGKRKKKNLRSLKRGVVSLLMPHLQKRGVTLLIKLKRNLKDNTTARRRRSPAPCARTTSRGLRCP